MSAPQKQFAEKLVSLGYRELTPIQRLAIPIALKGKNVLIIAPTGHGKTEAAVFPTFYMILNEKLEKISALYITPLRALNRDLYGRLERLGEELGIRVAVRHGDTSQNERKKIVSSPPDLLITTPETLQYLVVQEAYRKLLSNLRVIIIDEIQEMVDDKRGLELSIVLERLKRLTKHRPQMIGISATVGDVETAKRLLDPEGDVEVAMVDATKDMEVEIVSVRPDEKVVDEALKFGLSPELYVRLKAIDDLIEKYKPVLVFTNVRDTTEFLAAELKRLGRERVEVHHGSLSREVRTEVERKLKEGEVDAVVATSSLELGIDVGKINAVIQYASPRQVIRLVQRVGRSGHSLRAKSLGFLVPGPNLFDVLECKAIIDKWKEKYLEKPTVEYNAYDVVAHQLAGMVLEGYRDLRDVLSVINSSYFFRDFTMDQLREVASVLEAAKIVKVEGDTVRPYARTIVYYFGTNMIPDSLRDFTVIDVSSNTKVGSLDEEFVTALTEDSVFVLSGRLWKVVSIEEDRVYVEQTKMSKGMLPSWFGESIPVEKEVAMRVYDIISRAFEGDFSSVPEGLREDLERVVKEHASRGYPPIQRGEILVEVAGDLVIVHSPLGTRGNNTLGALLSTLFDALEKPAYRSSAYHIALASPSGISEDEVRRAVEKFLNLPKESLVAMLRRAVKKSPNFKWKLFTEAQRFGVLDRNADFNFVFKLLEPYEDTIVGEEAVNELLVNSYDVDAIDLARGMRWRVVKVPSPSPLAEEFLKQLLAASDSGSAPIMIEVIKRRLSNKDVRLVCLSCGWSDVKKASEVPERCPKCGSVFLGVTFPDDQEAVEVVRKNIKGERLKGKENKKLREVQAVASYYPRFNRYVALAIAARGVGPGNLSRVLSALDRGENEFFRAILEEEKRFLRTRKYWQED